MNDENKIVGLGDSLEDYPIQPKKHSREFLRDVAHLRSRTNLPKVEDKKEEKVVYEKSFKGLYDYITSQDTVGLLMLLLRTIIICSIITTFKLYGVDFVKEMGYSILNLFGIEMTDLIKKIWTLLFTSIITRFICDFVFYVGAIFVFVSIMTTRYDNLLKKMSEK